MYSIESILFRKNNSSILKKTAESLSIWQPQGNFEKWQPQENHEKFLRNDNHKVRRQNLEEATTWILEDA